MEVVEGELGSSSGEQGDRNERAFSGGRRTEFELWQPGVQNHWDVEEMASSQALFMTSDHTRFPSPAVLCHVHTFPLCQRRPQI